MGYFDNLLNAINSGATLGKIDRLADADSECYDVLTRACERQFGVGWTGLIEDVRAGYVDRDDLADVVELTKGLVI